MTNDCIDITEGGKYKPAEAFRSTSSENDLGKLYTSYDKGDIAFDSSSQMLTAYGSATQMKQAVIFNPKSIEIGISSVSAFLLQKEDGAGSGVVITVLNQGYRVLDDTQVLPFNAICFRLYGGHYFQPARSVRWIAHEVLDRWIDGMSRLPCRPPSRHFKGVDLYLT
jgi:hypothetical protein